MTPNVSKYLNKTILVSIPSLFPDGNCRALKLVGAEINGLWLESDELIERLLSEERQKDASTGVAVFVPFTQIAAVVVPLMQTSATPAAEGGNSAAQPVAQADAGQSASIKKKVDGC